MGGNKINMPNKHIERLAYQFRPYELAKVLPFQDALRFADRLLTIDPFYDPWRQYAIELLYSVREHYPKEWNASWRHDAYLGNLCAIAYRYNEKYAAYRQAMTKISPIPPELLVAFARCNSAPGTPLVSEEEALKILIEVVNKKPYKDVVRMIVKGGYKRFKYHPEELDYWEDLYKRLEESKQEEKLPEMSPNILNDEIKTDLSQLMSSPIKHKDEELFNIAKKVFSSVQIPFSVRGIVAEWKADEIVLWIYHEGELDADTESLSLMAYTRIAAHYLKDYINDNSKTIQIEDDLPYHRYWIFLRKDEKNQDYQ